MQRCLIQKKQDWKQRYTITVIKVLPYYTADYTGYQSSLPHRSNGIDDKA